MAGTLYIVPTPVGNLEDMTFRAVRVLKEADLILAEDTRTSSVLLKHYDIHGRLESHHLFKAEEMLAMRLSVMHNLYFYNTLTKRIRDSLDAGTFGDFRAEYSAKLSEKI